MRHCKSRTQFDKKYQEDYINDYFMLFANVNGQKHEATPKTFGICPLCNSTVFSKCGEINVWHWAHQKDEYCDNWYEPETAWHKSWKFVFGKDNCEIIIKREGEKHIADVLTNEGVVIELQNSPMPNHTAVEREKFYREQMIWIINGSHFRNNFTYEASTLSYGEQWYWRNEVVQTEYGIVDKETGELVTQPEKEYNFSWRWPRKSWEYAKRKIYIDFGDEYLFMVTAGMGTNQGKGKLISKKSFLSEHQGNLEFLETLINRN
ncbi:MAG: hypothetical protein IPI46_10120 [Bacteroidetes bacterium]|nr:hypothetical protein [Bacteroidota bacterium]